MYQLIFKGNRKLQFFTSPKLTANNLVVKPSIQFVCTNIDWFVLKSYGTIWVV